MSFVHLHTHSEYSLLEASLRIKSAVKKAAEMGMPALALTDNGNMFGAIEFYFACLDKNIKPILGIDVFLAPGSRHQKSTDRDQVSKPNTRLVLLAQNFHGYQQLCRISTVGYQEGFYYKPRIDYETLEKYNEDVICLSGGLRGEIPHTFLTEGPEAAMEKIKKLQAIFGDRFYLEVNRTGVPEWNKINPFLIEASKQTGVPLVAANDVHYINQDEQIAQEVLICIGSNRTLHDETRFRLGTDQFYLKSPEQMKELFKDIPEACENTLKIAERINIKFKFKDENGKAIYHLPTFATQDGLTVTQEIRRLSFEGLDVRFKEATAKGETVPEDQIPEYHKRLDYELAVIDRMGFNGYFLIVQDFINWAKTQDIPVGPGRGSGAGSLVAYCLRITDLDPIPHKLLFERFLNPERISMPDFDIDFCQDLRGRVIQYVTDKYGAASVSQIITYGKLQARAAIRDVGRVLGLTFQEVDVLSKLIPDKLNITLKEALEMEPRISELMETDPQMATLMDLAQKIEGLVRHAGIHAAGVIIADGELLNHAPLYRGADDENVVQYDMKHSEKIGLIKFDFLGLKTLTHIQRALRLVERNHGKKILPHEISLSDPGIYEIISKGDTLGIFQFEGDGITDAIRKIKPSLFADLTAINALYRPGPMAMIPEFAKRKHGEAPVEYLFDELKDSLEETYGIIVYQEQVMGIASRIGGYTLGQADMLRRAMGKKIKEEMDKQRVLFMEGAKKNGFDEKKSDELFDLMYKFADYGFNKSHAAAYCVIAAQTAWLKHYYPAEFFAALLSTEISNTDNVVKYVKDAQKRGIPVKPPHINHSEYLFNVVNNEIYFGLGAIKGVGENAIAVIMESREQLPSKKFGSLEEFFEKVDSRKLNKKVIECMIKAGAFDGFGYHRAQLMAGYPKFLDVAQERRKDEEIGQASLFDMSEPADKKIILENVKPWTRSASLAYEKEVLGFYLSDHPLKGYETLSKVWTTASVADVSKIPVEPKEKKRVIVSGLLSEKREVITRKGTRMAFGKIEDLTGSIEVIFFPDTYAKVDLVLRDEKPLLLAGNLEISEGGLAKIIVDSVTPLDEALKKSRKLTFHLHKIEDQDYPALLSILSEHPGTTKLDFIMDIPELKQKVQVETDIQGIQMSQDFFESIQTHFGRTDFIEVH